MRCNGNLMRPVLRSKKANVSDAQSDVRVNINETPKVLAEDIGNKIHATIFNDPLNPKKTLLIILVLKGGPSYLLSRKTISSEYEDNSIPHIDITSHALQW